MSCMCFNVSKYSITYLYIYRRIPRRANIRSRKLGEIIHALTYIY
jgi:hypothetical protein